MKTHALVLPVPMSCCSETPEITEGDVLKMLDYLRLMPIQGVHGYVTSALHEPIHNAKVSFNNNDTFTVADSLGHFEKPLPPGEYVVTVSKY